MEKWWIPQHLRNGTLWDDPAVCRQILSMNKSAHRTLVETIRNLHDELSSKRVLRKPLRRKLLILSILIADLEERAVLTTSFFSAFHDGAARFINVLEHPLALIHLLRALHHRFGGSVFHLTESDEAAVASGAQLARFASLVEGHTEPNGQMSLWRLYSFRDVPVDLLSHIYQLFVDDSSSTVYTPPNLVRLMLDESLDHDVLGRITSRNQIILDPACGSGIFLVEALRRLLLHWRRNHSWNQPRIDDVRGIVKHLRGIDVEEVAIELAEASLCLALCDCFTERQLASANRLFEGVKGDVLSHTCFFDSNRTAPIVNPIGLIVGNPPFRSELTTEGARRSYREYTESIGRLPDKQLAYLFIHEAMQLLVRGGLLAMVQPAGFIYNAKTGDFRNRFFERSTIVEILDFVSVRGLFRKGQADPKVVVTVAKRERPPANHRLLHAVFRRSARANAGHGFDIDYYDLHWVGAADLASPVLWRSNLLGGGRFRRFLERLQSYRTLETYARSRGWDLGEGYLSGSKGASSNVDHLIGRPLLPSRALSATGISRPNIESVSPDSTIKDPKTSARFTPPLLLIKEHEDLHHGMWLDHYLTYKNKIFGLAVPSQDQDDLLALENWLMESHDCLRAYLAGTSIRLFTQRATALASADIMAIPYPVERSLDLSTNEGILIQDVVTFARDFVRRGWDSAVMCEASDADLTRYAGVVVSQISALYPHTSLRPLQPYRLDGTICQPFAFNGAHVDWTGVNELKGKLDDLLHSEHGTTLTVTRIARIYDGRTLFLLKPFQLRYWLRSIALRDADDVRADLRTQDAD